MFYRKTRVKKTKGMGVTAGICFESGLEFLSFVSHLMPIKPSTTGILPVVDVIGIHAFPVFRPSRESADYPLLSEMSEIRIQLFSGRLESSNTLLFTKPDLLKYVVLCYFKCNRH